MSLCNVDFFDTDLSFLFHGIIESSEVSIDDDYLSAGESTISMIKSSSIPKYGFVHIGDPIDYWGYVQETEDDDDYTTVSYKPLSYIFDFTELIDVSEQGETALETVIKNAIDAHLVTNSDSLQNMPALSVTVTSSTTSWNLDLTADNEDSNYHVASIYSELIQPALTKYSIAINVAVDLSEKKVNATIGTVTNNEKTIDADLESVTIDTFDIDKTSNTTNKLRIYDTSDYTNYVEYYLYASTNTYGTTDEDRITPVVCEIKTASASESSSSSDDSDDTESSSDDSKTFEEAAAEVADNTFSGIQWTNLIELEVLPDDRLVVPLNLKFGQVCNIIYKGMQYQSILTGRQFGEQITLQFGTIRSEYTKRIRMNV